MFYEKVVLSEEAVGEEYNKLDKYGVFETVKIEDVPKNAKVTTSTWAMKKTASGNLQSY
jgi:hypothetical protein